MARPLTEIVPLIEKVRENREKFTDELMRQLSMPYDQVQKIASNFSQPSLVLLIARTLVKGITQSDVNRIAFLINNACGQLPKVVQVQAPEQAPRLTPPLVSLSSDQLFQALGTLTRQVSAGVPECKTVESLSSQSSPPSLVEEQPTVPCETESVS